MTDLLRILALFAGFWLIPHAQAQKSVYRCETGGKVSYSHEPCVGAKEIDATPTQGMDKMTGRSRKGTDVQRHEFDTNMANALKPLNGMTPDQYRVHRQRSALTPQDRYHCARLDATLPALKQRAATATHDERAAAEVELWKARKQFNDLNC